MKNLLNNLKKNTAPVAVFAIVMSVFAFYFFSGLMSGVEKENKEKALLRSLVTGDSLYLDSESLQDASLGDSIYAVIKTGESEYSTVRVIKATVMEGKYEGGITLRLPNGDLYTSDSGTFLPEVVLRNGEKIQGQVVQSALTVINLTNGNNLVVELSEAQISEGKITSTFVGRGVNTGYRIAAITDTMKIKRGFVVTTPTYVPTKTRVYSFILALEKGGLEPQSLSEQKQIDKVLSYEDSRREDGNELLSPEKSGTSGELQRNEDLHIFEYQGTVVRPDYEKGTYEIAGLEEGSDVSTDLVHDMVLQQIANIDFSPYIDVDIATTTGGGFTLQDNSVLSRHIKDGEIVSADIADATVTGTDIKNDSIKNEDIATGAVNSDKIEDGTVTASDIKNDTVGAGQLSGTITLSDGDFLDLGAIVHNDAAPQGLRLPNVASASPTLPSSGEGYLAYDTLNNQVLVYNGASWSQISGSLTLYSGSSTTSTTSSSSGMELINSDELTLIRGCDATNNILKWNNATGVWECNQDIGAGGVGISTIKEGGTNVVTSALAINFAASDFGVTDAGAGQGNVAIDYTNSHITRDNQTQSISGAWTFTNGLTVSAGTISLPNSSITNSFLANSSVTVTAGTGLSGGGLVALGGTISLASTLGTSISNAEIDADTVDWSAISDSMTLDNNTLISASSALNLTVGDNVNLVSSGTGTIIATDLNCTNCIGSTELADITLGTDTAGNYVATIDAGNGLASTGATTGESIAHTLSVNTGNGIQISSDAIAVKLGNLGATATGLQADGNGLSLITTCADNKVLKYTSAGGWACADDTDTNTNYWSLADGLLSPANGGAVVGATSSATTVATFTSSGTNDAIQAGSASNYITIDSNGNLNLRSQQDIKLYDTDNSHYSGFQAHATTTQSGVYTLPAAYPGSSAFIKSDNSGNLSFDTATYDNYTSWSFSVDGVLKDPLTSVDSLDFVSGSGITVTRSAEDQLTFTATDTSATNELQNLWSQITSQSGSTSADSTTDNLTVNGAGIASTAITGDTLTITATEADTLTSVVGRNATTTTLVNLNGGITATGARVGQPLVQLTETGDQDILTASSGSTTRFRIANNGDVLIGSGTFNNASGSEDFYVSGNAEVDGTIYGALTGNVTGNVSGSAGSVLFSGVGSATNTNTLVIGNGGSLVTSGTGTITATDLSCTDCIAVDEISDVYILNTGDTGMGVYDFGDATSFEVPNGASPTVDAAGEIAIKTPTAEHTGLISYHDGTEAIYAIGVPVANLTTTDDQVLAYDADSNEFYFKNDAIGGTINSFETLSVPAGSNPVADSSTDTLTFTNGTGISISGNSGSDTITIAHADSSSTADSTNTGTTVIQSLGFDDLGHVDSLGTVDVATALSSTFDKYTSWSIGDDDNDTYAIASGNILRFTSSDSNILTNLANGDDADENLDLTVRLLGDIVAGNGLTGGANDVLVGADGDTTISINLDTTDSKASGLVTSASGLSLLRTCGLNQVLKWDTTNGWGCGSDLNTGTNFWTNNSGVISPDSANGYNVIAATSSATTVATFTTTGGANALAFQAGGEATFVTIDKEGDLDVDGAANIGAASASVPQLIVNGGDSGGDIIQLARTSGATLTYGWNLAGNKLSFRNVTNDVITFQTSRSVTMSNTSEVNVGMDYGTGVTQTGDQGLIKGSDSGGAGTDSAGGDLYIASGRGTGAATASKLYLQTPDTTTSGTSRQALATRLTLDSTSAIFSGNLDVNGTSNDIAGTLNLSGAGGLTFGTTGGITLAGGAISDGTDEVDINDALAVANALQVGGTTAVAFSRFGTGTAGHTAAGEVEDTSDVFITDDLEVDGTIFADGGITGNLTGSATDVNCTDCLDFTEFAVNMSLDETTTITAGSTFDLGISLSGSSNEFYVENGSESLFIVGGDGTISFTGDTVFDLAGSENIEIDSTSISNSLGLVDINVTASGSINSDTTGININLTNADDVNIETNVAQVIELSNGAVSADDTTYGLYINNLSDVGTTDALIALNNSDTNTAVNDGIIITSAAGTITDAIDISDASGITNAINLGPNDIIGTTADINFDNFDIIGSSGNADFGGTITAGSSNITLTDSTGYILHDSLVDCGDGQILKWVTGGNRWGCAVDDTGGSTTLQQAYDAGNTITTDATGDITITLAELATPTTFEIFNADTAGVSAFEVDNTIATGTLTNGFLLEQSGAGTMTNGVHVLGTAGTITDGIHIEDGAGAITDGLQFTGTFTNLINSTNFIVSNAGVVTADSIVLGNDTTDITSATGENLTLVADGAGIISLNDSITATGTLTFSGPTPDITTATDEDLDLSAAGTADMYLYGDADSQVIVYDNGAAAVDRFVVQAYNVVTNNVDGVLVDFDVNSASVTNSALHISAGGTGAGNTLYGAFLESSGTLGNVYGLVFDSDWDTDITTESGLDGNLTISADGTGDVVFQLDSDTAVVFSGGTTDITTGTNETLTLSPNGTGAFVVNSGGTSASAIDINATGTVAGNAITLDTTDGGIALTAAGAANGDIIFNAADTLLLDSGGVLELNSSGGIISIGNDDVAQNINIGSDGARAINIGAGGAGNTTAIILATDSTGNGEIVLPNDAIGADEIWSSGQDDGDCLKWGTGDVLSWDTCGGTNYWQLLDSSAVLAPANGGAVIAATSSATTVATFTASGSNYAFQAGGASNYLTIAANADVSQLVSETTGTAYLMDFDTITQGIGIDLSMDGLTTGTGLLIDDNTASGLSTGTLLQVQSKTEDTGAIADGMLGYFNWDPATSTTKSGDLFRINIGNLGTTSGYLFNITDNGSSLFSVSETQVTSNLPTAFTATGDITIAGNIVMSNQTTSGITAKGPMTIFAGDTFESNDLTLKTYNAGQVLVDSTALGGLGVSSNVSGYNLDGLFSVEGAKTGKALVILNEAGDQDIFTASASGTTQMTLGRTGNLSIAGDMTITGDDLYLGTNTTGFMLVADGTNYNPVDVSGDIDINSSGVTTLQDSAIDYLDFDIIDGDSAGNGDCLSYDSGGTNGTLEWVSCGGGTAALDTLTVATTDDTALDNDAWSIAWNWDFSATAVDSGLTISESSASSGGNQDQQALLELVTLATSTASPLQVTAGGTDVADVWFDLTGDADFQIRDGGAAVLTIDQDGLTTVNDDTTFTLAAAENVIISNTTLTSDDLVSITGTTDSTTTSGTDAVQIAFTQSDDGDATDTNSAVQINVTSSSGDAGDVLYGININTLTPGSATETALNIGSGWDQGLTIADAGTASIILSSTDGDAASGITFGSSTPVYVFRTATGELTISDTTTAILGTDDFFQFDTQNGPVYSGLARPHRKVTLTPEYPGAVLTGTDTGTMTSDFCEQGVSADITDTNTSICESGQIHNYYSWTTNSGSKTYSIYIRWRVPDNFSAWDTDPVQIYGRVSDATDGSVTATIFDTASAVENSGGTAIDGTSDTWTQTTVEALPLEGTYTAGSYMTIKIDLQVTGSDTAQVGEINLNYLSNN